MAQFEQWSSAKSCLSLMSLHIVIDDVDYGAFVRRMKLADQKDGLSLEAKSYAVVSSLAFWRLNRRFLPLLIVH